MIKIPFLCVFTEMVNNMEEPENWSLVRFHFIASCFILHLTCLAGLFSDVYDQSLQLKNWASVITERHQNWAPGPNSNGCCQNGNPFCLSNILTSSIQHRVECLEVCSSPSSWSSTSVRSCPAQKVFFCYLFSCNSSRTALIPIREEFHGCI